MIDKRKKEYIKKKICILREELFRQKEKIEEIEDLIKSKIEHHYQVNLWELSENELDTEMGTRLTFLNEDIDCTSRDKITSHRKIIGVFLVFFKKIIKRRILNPCLIPTFERQKRFNESAVAFHLSSFIRFSRMEQKLRELDKNIEEIKEKLDTIEEAINFITEKLTKNGPKSR